MPTTYGASASAEVAGLEKWWPLQLGSPRGKNMEIPQELRMAYLDRRKRDLEQCKRSLSGDGFQEIERLGHKLKGSGATFGHPRLSELGELIEIAAKEQDRSKIAAHLKELSIWLTKKH
jgi:HPt (histidine-containing phosphotransfer) domain-containing protein